MSVNSVKKGEETALMRFLKNFYYSFAFQLLLLQLKKHHLLLAIWLVLFLIITSNFASKFGVPYLFLDPEFLGKVNIWSFMLLGFAYAGFLMSWNVTTYILHSFRFHFLATLEKPFAKYCLNNSIIPITFILVFIIELFIFQYNSEFRSKTEILLQITGFLIGIIVFLALAFTYFFSTNKNIFKLFGVKEWEPGKGKRKMGKNQKWGDEPISKKAIPVKSYLAHPFRVRLVRDVGHYDSVLIKSVLRHHHLNALGIELFALAGLLGLGLLVENEFFRIPAGGSIFIIFSILIMFIGGFSFWLRGWRVTVFLVMFVLLNYLIRFELYEFKNKAYGLNYNNGNATYDLNTIRELNSRILVRKDKQNTLRTLELWKKKCQKGLPRGYKPKMVFVNTSGGGLRSAVWSTWVLQYADSILNGQLFHNTFIITGASAGMIGAAYYRELYMKQQADTSFKLTDRTHIDAIAKDILNPVAYSLFVNDIFFPIQSFRLGNKKYRKDRGYFFEKQLNENLGNMLSKDLGDYTEAEQNSDIPMMIVTPTISNDGRKLFISTQSLSYLTQPLGKYPVYSQLGNDGIDFLRLFKEQDAMKIKFSSVLRMNATFPYITPRVFLPTDPTIEVMDAGMRDNFGMQTTVRFLHVFKDWINANTSGVIVLQIRDSNSQGVIAITSRESFIDKLMNPIGSFYSNWSKFQDFNNDNLIDLASTWMYGKLDLVRFEYVPSLDDEPASLSWHLTTGEKRNIIKAINSDRNQASITHLRFVFE